MPTDLRSTNSHSVSPILVSSIYFSTTMDHSIPHFSRRSINLLASPPTITARSELALTYEELPVHPLVLNRRPELDHRPFRTPFAVLFHQSHANSLTVPVTVSSSACTYFLFSHQWEPKVLLRLIDVHQ